MTTPPATQRTMQTSAHIPRVSIGLPVYNGDDYLEGAIESILAQTYEDFELIISDNASTDRTEDICRTYAAQDDRIRYMRSPQNLGGSPNFNRLVDFARGEYFRWACHDDLIAPRGVEACVAVLDREPDVALCYTKTTMIDEHGDTVTRDNLPLRTIHSMSPHANERFGLYLQKYLYGGFCNPLYGVIRTDVLKQTARINNYPDSDLVLIGELTLWGKVYEVNEPLFLRRMHPQRTMEAYPTAEARAEWFDPKNKGKLVLPHWRFFYEYQAAFWRAPISAMERARSYRLLFELYVNHHKWKMTDEFKHAIRSLPSRIQRTAL